MESTATADSAYRDIFLAVDGMNADAVWSRVDQERDAGRDVWLAGELVEPFARSFGLPREGRNSILVPRRTAQHEWAYRVRDILVSALALILLAPVFAILAVMVKRSSPGPVFYMAVVVGRAQRHFVWRKFRSMIAADQHKDYTARADQFRVFAEQKHRGKLLDASRVTPIGRFLRKHSLDELPQLWNVLRGDMALVGPRPCLPYEAEVVSGVGAATISSASRLDGSMASDRARTGQRRRRADDGHLLCIFPYVWI